MRGAELAHINPDIILWALEKRGLTPEQISSKTMPAARIRAWQQKESLPTHVQAESLAQKLRIPYLLLFLAQRPSMELEIPDLRTVSGEPEKTPSNEFVQVVNDALVKQDWYRELQQRISARLPFVGKYANYPNADLVAQDIRTTLALEQVRSTATSWKEFLNEFIANSEALGIFVFRSALVGHDTRKKLSVREFRGFVLSDEWAPMVFINDDDAKAAQTFTLAHELAHIWIGKTGISDPNLKKRSAQLVNPIERLCNRIAAEALVPADDFNRTWNERRDLNYNLSVLGVRYRVSSLVILIRAHELEKVSQHVFDTRFDEEMARFRAQDKKDKIKKLEEVKKKKQEGDFWASFAIRNSRSFADLVVSEVKERRTRFTDGASLLGVRPSTFERYLQRLEGES